MIKIKIKIRKMKKLFKMPMVCRIVKNYLKHQIPVEEVVEIIKITLVIVNLFKLQANSPLVELNSSQLLLQHRLRF